MAPPAGTLRVGRYFLALAILFIVLFTIVLWPGTDHAPKLGLDLRGGAQVIYKAQTTDRQDAEQLVDEPGQDHHRPARQRPRRRAVDGRDPGQRRDRGDRAGQAGRSAGQCRQDRVAELPPADRGRLHRGGGRADGDGPTGSGSTTPSVTPSASGGSGGGSGGGTGGSSSVGGGRHRPPRPARRPERRRPTARRPARPPPPARPRQPRRRRPRPRCDR